MTHVWTAVCARAQSSSTAADRRPPIHCRRRRNAVEGAEAAEAIEPTLHIHRRGAESSRLIAHTRAYSSRPGTPPRFDPQDAHPPGRPLHPTTTPPQWMDEQAPRRTSTIRRRRRRRQPSADYPAGLCSTNIQQSRKLTCVHSSMKHARRRIRYWEK